MTISPLPQEKVKCNYGVWVPCQGWKRDNTGKVIAFDDLALAAHVARRLGNGAWAGPVDASIVSLEQDLLAAEDAARKSTLWFKARAIFKHPKD